MKSIFMRVLFCKIHCPSFICFCKPSAAAQLYTSGPLNLENSSNILPLGVEPVGANTNSNASSDQLSAETIEVNDEAWLDDEKPEQTDNEKPEQALDFSALKSCIKPKEVGSESVGSKSGEVEKKKVQWVDDIGKELAHIKEFESSETWDIDYDDERGCDCVIL